MVNRTIVKRLGAKVVETDAEFKPIRLGVLDGMNGEQQRKLYPEVSSANEKWRKGEGDIKEGLAEGAQPAIEYYNQIKGFIDGLPDNGVYILVGTRSDVICLKNIFSNQSPEQDMCYQYYDIDYVQTEILMEHKGRQQVIKMSKMLTGLSRPGPKKDDIDFK